MQYQVPSIFPEQLSETFVSENKKKLSQLLSCFICYQRARGASMCPFCSKIYCENCIKRSLVNKQQCPNCRKSLKTNSMTYCSRFVNQLSFLLEDLIEMKTVDQKCIQHNVEQNYYCRTCGLPICCECEMFGEHKGHHIDDLGRIYELNCQPVRDGLLLLKKQLKEKEGFIKEIQTKSPELIREKERRIAEAEQNNQMYKIKIFAQLQSSEKILQECESIVRENLKQAEQLEDDLVKRINNSNKLSSENDKIRNEELEKIDFEIPQRQPVQEQLNKIMRELIPPYQEVTYTVENFSRRRKQKSIVYSPIVNLDGTQWRLKIHPNGNQKAESTHLSIYLELNHSIVKNNIYQYRIEISNPCNPNICFYRQYNSNFEENGSCWGYIKYMKLDDLLRGGYLDNDCLNIRYSIRHPSYYYYSLFQQEYCANLDQQLKAQEELIFRLQEDVQFGN